MKLIIAAIFSLPLLAQTPAYNYPAAVMSAPSPVAYWRLDQASGTNTDLVNGYVATPQGTVNFAQPGALYSSTDTSISQNSNGYLTVDSPGSSALTFTNNTSFTVTAWVKPNMARSTFQEFPIASHMNDADSANEGWYFNLRYDPSIGGGKTFLRFIIQQDHGRNLDCEVFGYHDIPNNQWTYVAATYDSTVNQTSCASGMKLYVNGNYEPPTVNNSNITGTWTVTDPARIGGMPGFSEYLLGGLDEVAIFGAALTPYQIVTIGANGVQKPSFSAGQSAIPIIIDTESGSDIDQAFWVQIAEQMREAGLLDIRAYMSSSSVANSSASLDVQLQSIRGYKTSGLIGAWHGAALADPDWYATGVVNSFSSRWAGLGNQGAYPDCVEKYRQVLNAAASNSVVIDLNGPFGACLGGLLASASGYSGDGILSTGVQLVTNKVAYLIALAGAYPTGAEYNIFSNDNGVRANTALSSWPSSVPIYWSGVQMMDNNTPSSNENPWNVIVGDTRTLLNSYLSTAYTAFLGGGTYGIEPAFGLPVYLWLAGGYNAWLSQTGPGSNTINTSNGSNTWSATNLGQYYLNAAGSLMWFKKWQDDQTYAGTAPIGPQSVPLFVE